MKLVVETRNTGRKGETNKLRRLGNIPAVIYGDDGKEGRAVSIRSEEMKAIIRKMEPGHLATTIFELEENGKTVKAIIKDVQYHKTSYDVEHIDFLPLNDKRAVTINVPIRLLGVADCAGIKLGGFLRPVVRSCKVSCLPKDIPTSFDMDVTELSLGQSKALGDLNIPKNVRPLAKLDQVFVLVAKKAGS